MNPRVLACPTGSFLALLLVGCSPALTTGPEQQRSHPDAPAAEHSGTREPEPPTGAQPADGTTGSQNAASHGTVGSPNAASHGTAGSPNAASHGTAGSPNAASHGTAGSQNAPNPSAASAQEEPASRPSNTPSETATGNSAVPVATLPPPKGTRGGHFFCFAWLDHRHSGQNCYFSLDACQRHQRDWPPNTTHCESHPPPVFCHNVHEAGRESLRCFGELDFCKNEQSRLHWLGQGFSECVGFE
ncbi:MAG: hypothetical protein QM784_37150 [Polyangiaceae bacterium]